MIGIARFFVADADIAAQERVIDGAIAMLGAKKHLELPTKPCLRLLAQRHDLQPQLFQFVVSPRSRGQLTDPAAIRHQLFPFGIVEELELRLDVQLG